uniref:M-myrmeciitoxin-Mp2b n=1 Tax=Myrmecia pilosula TaxID=13618 RepID=TX2B_MYRPI|nr:RecName: Full=M-myrmeciitoxin-Mp2b; Short=M-MIITX-Mp2b; AltName: Full=DELTA-myrtoxin-Mp1a B chain; Short=Mp1a B chain; AltName: Full=Pilosin-3 subunit b; Short=Pilosulin-3b [Myrmecia pilosula]
LIGLVSKGTCVLVKTVCKKVLKQ